MARLTVAEQSAMLNDPKNQIPWDEFRKWGLTPDFILQEDLRQEAHGAVVNKFINHGFSPVFKVQPDFKSNSVSVTGQLSGAARFYVSGDKVKIEFQIARPEYKLSDDIVINDRTILHANSDDPQEKAAHDNLIEFGYANVPVEVYDPRWVKEDAGARQMCIVALDRSDDKHVGTNQANYVKCSWVEKNLDKKEGKVCGAVLTDDEKKIYLSGGEVFLKGMKKSTGGTFDGFVRYDPISGMNAFSNGMSKKASEAAGQKVEVALEQKTEQAQTKKNSRKM